MNGEVRYVAERLLRERAALSQRMLSNPGWTPKEAFITRKWVELFIFQHLSCRTYKRAGDCNLKLCQNIILFFTRPR